MPRTQPELHGDDSSSESVTLIGSGLERFTANEESGWGRSGNNRRLEDLRAHMARDILDY